MSFKSFTQDGLKESRSSAVSNSLTLSVSAEPIDRRSMSLQSSLTSTTKCAQWTKIRTMACQRLSLALGLPPAFWTMEQRSV